jgi:phospholipase/carboxylesterase
LTAPEQILEIAGLRSTIIGEANAPLTVVLLHGFSMTPADLAPFAHSLSVPARFVLPQGPVSLPGGGAAWWESDRAGRPDPRAIGWDLFDEDPAGLDAARTMLGDLLSSLRSDAPESFTVLGGFSQGGMLTMDYALRGSHRLDALALLSSSRIAYRKWLLTRARLYDLPVLISHGSTDSHLAFAAGEALRDFCIDSDARVTWIPFAGGHEIPLAVWRALRKQLISLITDTPHRLASHAQS